jgi:lia operon protein LiaF
MRSSSNLIWGLIFIAAGVIFLLDNYGYIYAWDVVRTYWPLVLVAIGLKILWDVKQGSSATVIGAPSDHNWEQGSKRKSGYASTSTTDILSESNIMGDVKLTINSEQFQGGSVNTVFGDTKLDLSSIQMAAGEHTLRISGVFGDVKIDTPQNLAIQVTGNTLAGDITIREYKKSGIGQSLTYQSQDYETADKKLHINISQVFGDLKIY